MKAKRLQYLVPFALLMLLGYLSGALGFADWNIARWPETDRLPLFLIYGALGTFASFLLEIHDRTHQ